MRRFMRGNSLGVNRHERYDRPIIVMLTWGGIMPGNRGIWWVWLLVLLSYVVPYTLLSDVQAWYGSFLFWTAVGLLVVVLNILITRRF